MGVSRKVIQKCFYLADLLNKCLCLKVSGYYFKMLMLLVPTQKNQPQEIKLKIYVWNLSFKYENYVGNEKVRKNMVEVFVDIKFRFYVSQ